MRVKIRALVLCVVFCRRSSGLSSWMTSLTRYDIGRFRGSSSATEINRLLAISVCVLMF